MAAEQDSTTVASPLLLPQQQQRKQSSAAYLRCRSHASDELRSFRSCLRWLCVDQSTPATATLSWSLFVFLTFIVPAASHALPSYADSRRAYDLTIQLSLTCVAATSYLCLSGFVRRYGLRRFLFLDKLVHESERVRLGYTAQLSRSFQILSCFVLPCFATECGYKIWWYCTGSGRIPVMPGNQLVMEAIACTLELASWIYRTGIFFLVCVLFRLICHLQILRLQDFAEAFEGNTSAETVLRSHILIRRQLQIISHRYRAFLVGTLVIVSVSQFIALLLTTRPRAQVTFYNTGELALCSIGLVTGLCICFRCAAKITHKAQAITSHAATWHVCATIEPFDADPETTSTTAPPRLTERVLPFSDADDSGDDDELDDRKLISSQANTISFQRRQALVTYLENNRAGISVFGFVMDRTYLHMVFMIEFSLVLWLLGKTIGIS